MKKNFFVIQSFLVTCLFSTSALADRSPGWSVCGALEKSATGKSISEDDLNRWLAQVDKPKSLEISSERAVRIRLEASMLGLTEIDERTWRSIDSAAKGLYAGKWKAFTQSVDANNDNQDDSVVVYRDSSSPGVAFAYFLSESGHITGIRGDGRPLVVRGELFRFGDETYWFQVDPLIEGSAAGYLRNIRIYRPEKATESFLLPSGVNGVLCEFVIKEGK